MEFQCFVVGELATNCYLLWSGHDAGVVDPGGEVEEIEAWISHHQLALKWILNTHGHMDHIRGNAALKGKYGAELCIHEADQEMLVSSLANFSMFFGLDLKSPAADRILRDGDRLRLGIEELNVISVPGHSAGGIALYTPGLLFAGDALFRGSIGRTDFPGGDHHLLIKGIKERLLVLPPDTLVLPGHGPATTIDDEKKYNPFLNGSM